MSSFIFLLFPSTLATAILLHLFSLLENRICCWKPQIHNPQLNIPIKKRIFIDDSVEEIIQKRLLGMRGLKATTDLVIIVQEVEEEKVREESVLSKLHEIYLSKQKNTFSFQKEDKILDRCGKKEKKKGYTLQLWIIQLSIVLENTIGKYNYHFICNPQNYPTEISSYTD